MTLQFLLDEIDSSNKKIRDFGLVMWIIPGIIVPLFIAYKNAWNFELPWIMYLAGGGIVFFLLTVALPKVMKPLYIGWMLLALVLGLIMTRVIVFIVFFTVMTPIGLIMTKLAGKDILKTKAKTAGDTFWVEREPEKELSQYERLF